MTVRPRPCSLGCRDHATGEPHQATPGLAACDPCAEHLAGQLADLERLAATLDDPVELLPTRSGGRGAPGYGSRSPALDHLIAHRDVRSVPADDMPAPALAVLEQWARAIREDTTLDTPTNRIRGTVPTGRATLARELGTIRWHWHHVLSANWLPDFAGELRQVLEQLRTAARTRTPALRLTCPVVVDMDEPEGDTGPEVPIACGATLHVRAGDESIRCPGCGTEWPRGRWHELSDPWVDYATLAELLGIPTGTLRRWAHEDAWATSGPRGRRLVSRIDALTSYARRRETHTRTA